jgi:hypothetical protein
VPGWGRRGGAQENRIQVFNTKKPLFFYVNLTKVRTRAINPICLFCCGENTGVSILFASYVVERTPEFLLCDGIYLFLVRGLG